MKVLLLLLVSVVGTYSQAPDYCDLNPSTWIRHQTGPQFMFFITTDPKCYKSGGQVKVHLFSDITKPFTGFVIKASKRDGVPVGKWTVQSPLETVNCYNGLMNVIMMKESLGLNRSYVQLTWTAPFNIRDNIIFNATFTDKTGNEWKNVTSAPIVYNASCGAVPTKVVTKNVCDLLPTNMVMMDNRTAWLNYGIALSQTCYKRSDAIKVSLFANLRNPFYGFVLQARMMDPWGPMKNMAYGKFIRDETNKVEVWGCHENHDNTLYLPQSTKNYTVIEMMWTPTDVGSFKSVIFNATVVDDKGVSTVNITSQPLKYDMYCGESVVPSGRPITGGAQQLMTSLVYVLIIMTSALLY